MTQCGCQKKVRKKKGFFEKPLFDFNEDGKTDCMEWSIGMQMIASSSQEEIESTEDDAFYLASDDLEDEDDEDILELYGLDRDELDMMDEDERREALEEVGLDPDDYEEY